MASPSTQVEHTGSFFVALEIRCQSEDLVAEILAMQLRWGSCSAVQSGGPTNSNSVHAVGRQESPQIRTVDFERKTSETPAYLLWTAVPPVHVSSRGPPDPAQSHLPLQKQVLETTGKVILASPTGAVTGRLEFAKHGEDTDNHYDMLFDLGSNDFWVISKSCEGKYRGAPEYAYPARGWIQTETETRHYKISNRVFEVTYVDGSVVRYKLHADTVRFPPSPHLGQINPTWSSVSLGVAFEVEGCIVRSPFSGVVGLGRRMLNELPASFLHQIRDILTSPEMTIMLGRDSGRITFGMRPSWQTDNPADQQWSKNIPVVDTDHWCNLWMVTSPKKRLNGEEILTPGGLAIFDTGTPFCWLDTEIVEKFYRQVPHKKHVATGIFLIPKNFVEYPSFELQLGEEDDMFQVSTFFDSHYKLDADQGAIGYQAGAIQPKSLISEYGGPDIIGRVVLINMELNLQFPPGSSDTHKVAWRQKRAAEVGVRANW
ncbi:aspartic peptidase domain-containing protein, partial [Mycena galopus ATCC 62051]